jgi:hypothetical protein
LPNGPYWDEGFMMGEGKFPEILALGDSWFCYPFNNLLNPIHNLWAGGRVILAQGGIGAEAVELASGRCFKNFRAALRGYPSIRAVLLSAGGNDFAGLDDMSAILKPDCSGETSGAGCFKPDALEKLMFRDVIRAYRKLIREVERWRPGALVFLHNYDYALPSGQGILGFGGWLKQPMDLARVPPALQPQAVNYLIDTFSDALAQVQREFPDRTLLVDSSGVLSPADWANELHPTISGFNKVVERAWQQPLLDNLA